MSSLAFADKSGVLAATTDRRAGERKRNAHTSQPDVGPVVARAGRGHPRTHRHRCPPLDLALPASASFHFVFSNKTAHDSVCLEVVASLKSLGIKVWQQTTSIPKDSTNWFKEWYPNAVKALKIVCFISVAYLKSEFCMKEMSVALSCRNALIVTLDPLDDIMGVEKELQQYPWASDALAYLRTGGQVIVHLDVQRTVEDVIKFMPRLTSPPEPQLGSPPAGTGPKLSTIKTLSALAAASEETEEDLLAYDGDELSELFALFELDVVSKKKIKREIAARTEGGGSNSLDTGTPSSPGGAATQDLGAAQQMLQMQHQMQLMEQQRQMFDMQKLEMAQQAATVEAKVAADALAAQQRVDMAAKKSAEALQVTQAKLQAKSEKLEEQRAALQLQSAEIAQHMASMAAFEQHPNAIALTNPRYPNLPFDGFGSSGCFTRSIWTSLVCNWFTRSPTSSSSTDFFPRKNAVPCCSRLSI